MPTKKKNSVSLKNWIIPLLLVLTISCRSENPQNSSDIKVSVNQQTGAYTISTARPEWSFSGTIGQKLSKVQSDEGQDSIGTFHETSFHWSSDHTYTGSIKWYDHVSVVLFSLTTPEGADQIKETFPDFQGFPQNMHHYSFKDERFAPYTFKKLPQASTPWLFFNDKDQAFILSPASDFLVSQMQGDGTKSIASGLNPELQNLPQNFSHQSILVLGEGIRKTWQQWGNALQRLYGKKAPANDADPVLKYYGYWTDNGADYYYNYDKKLGYEGTLLAVKNQYKKEGIPFGYMQLDSWWYEKSIYDPEGKPVAGHKNKEFPKGKWNRYGGLMKYRPDPFVLPDGMTGFHKKLGKPLMVHNRWIDPHSPYHDRYDIAGYAAIDSQFWNDIAKYLKQSGIAVYEQDWLDYIYNQTPEMASNLSIGNAFTNGMATAFKNQGIDMQYCMAMPRFFMQGLKYDNLTSIRTSNDRFEPGKWKDFLYASQLARSMGIWPWSDVFKSHETGNMIVSVLSGGVVGTGDALGKEDKKNIMKVSRTDGVLVKPDAALLPMDSDYIHAANGENKPMLASTYTKHHEITTDYVFAFAPNDSTSKEVVFQPSALGQQGKVVVYNELADSVRVMDASDQFMATLGDAGYALYQVAPITPVGIAFLGDADKIASTGKQRISGIESSRDALQISVSFVPGESSVTLHGYYDKTITADKGKLTLHPDRKMFDLVLPASEDTARITVHFTNS